jgi:uncharacterized membrane-anchored protein
MRIFHLVVSAVLLVTGTQSQAQTPATSAAPPQLPWVDAPATVVITDNAKVKLAKGTAYLDAKGTDQLLKLTGNLPEETSYTIASQTKPWFAIYSFDPMGYVKDDEKIDADALLKSLQENQEIANEVRKEQGLGPLTVLGWAVPPHYDPKTHNLEYGIKLRGNGNQDNINYHLRMLGRKGVMDAALITAPDTLQADLAEFRLANTGFNYDTGEDYASYQTGDKVSEYGLAALVTGGAAAAALKGGLLKGLLAGLAAFWKIIAAGVIALFAFVRKLIGRRDADQNEFQDE